MSSLRLVLTPLFLALLAILPARAQPAPPSTLSTGEPPIVETLGADLRLESDDDESAVLALAAGSLRGAPRVALDEARGLVALTRTHDERLYRGAVDVGAAGSTPGLRGALDGAASGR